MATPTADMNRRLAMLQDRQRNTLLAYSESVATMRSGSVAVRLDGSKPSMLGMRGMIDSEFPDSGMFLELLDPIPEARTASVKLARQMEQLFIGGITRTVRPDRYGPGRLRGSEVVKMYAAARQGKPMPPGLKPFRKTTLARSPRTPMKLGFILDTSFSMDHVSQLGAHTAWLAVQATRAIKGKVAMTSFGYDAWGLVAPGESMPQVPHLTMVGGHHMAHWAYELLDSQLHLADADGARTLMVFSDLEVNHNYADNFAAYLDEAARNGVAIVVVTPGTVAETLSGRGAVSVAVPPEARVVSLQDIAAFRHQGFFDPDPKAPGGMEALAAVLGEAVVEGVRLVNKQS